MATAVDTLEHDTGEKGLKTRCARLHLERYYSSDNGTWFGVGQAFIIGIGFLVVGVVLMFVYQRISPEFFRKRPEVVDDYVAIHGAVPQPGGGD